MMAELIQGLSKQHALLTLILAFPLDLMIEGFAVWMLINRPEISGNRTCPNTQTQRGRETIQERPSGPHQQVIMWTSFRVARGAKADVA
jgi:hypothetical protein